ncbi:MAG: pyridine nucleotide-disulfide oxidoreductase, partial [Luteibacter sp.]
AWERARHRMPPQVHKKVHALEAAGKLHRLRGRMQSVALRMDGDLDVIRRITGSDDTLTETYDIVIQTVGLNTDTVRTDHTLMRQLVIDGLVTPDRMGLGLAAQPDGHLLDGNGKPRGNLFAIGSLLRGALWESTAIPEIRKQAQSLATLLTAK